MHTCSGDLVRERLAALERNQAWLARKLGVDISTVYRWVAEGRPIPDKRLPVLAEVLGCDVEDLRVEQEPAAA